MKFGFIIVEVTLAIGMILPCLNAKSKSNVYIAFGALNRTKKWNAAAIVEWVIALVYTFWVLSFVIDFLPAASPKNHQMNTTPGANLEEAAIENAGVAHDDSANRYGRTFGNNGDVHYPSGTTASGGVTHGWTNGHNKESDPRSMI
jgi:hypothetical protein